MIAEMILGKALFPGSSSAHQWELIVNFTGFKLADVSGYSEDIQ